MSEHYYTKEPSSAHEERTIRETILGRSMTFVTDAGVFSKDGIDKGTRALVESIPPLSGQALDLGCGWGAAGIPLALQNPECAFLLHRYQRAGGESCASERARERRGQRARGDRRFAFAAVDGAFSAIFTNPPIRAGKQTIYAMFAEARARLNPGGCLYVVIRKQQGAPSALNFLRETFQSAEVIAREGGYWVIRAEKRQE